MKKLTTLMLISILSLSLLACEKQSTTDQEDTDTQEEVVTTTTTDEEEAETETEEGAETEEGEEETMEITERSPGEIPFDYPVVANTTAKTEEYVLAPSNSSINDAFKDEDQRTTMIFYHRKMLEPGANESKIEEYSSEVNIPNSVIIPLPTGETAQPGDIILTWWQTGSGMTRAIVVANEESTESSPMVKYLDLSFDYEPEKIKENSFHVLTQEMEPGTAVAVKDGDEYQHEIIINVSGDNVLTSGFASILKVRNKTDLIPVPIKPSVNIGDKVHIPILGTFKEGIVLEVDESNGRVKVEYEWAGTSSQELFGFGDVIKDLPT